MTWGREEDGVWVDRGCRAAFLLAPEPPRRVERTARLDPGTIIPVRSNDTIRADRVDGRIFTGVVAQDVFTDTGLLAIPRGSNVELVVRVAKDQDLILDLDTIAVEGQRYVIDAAPARVEAKDGVGANQRTGKYVGGGAIMGAIIGAAAGGGKGAAIGAGIGAGAGAVTEMATSGREVRVPAESVIRFQLDRSLDVVVNVVVQPDGMRDRR